MQSYCVFLRGKIQERRIRVTATRRTPDPVTGVNYYIDFKIRWRLLCGTPRTCMADIPTNALSMLSNNFGSRLVMMFTMSIPLGLKTASHFSMARANIGMRKSCIPMPSHWDPIPENTNQTGGFSFVMGWKKTHTHTRYIYLCVPRV